MSPGLCDFLGRFPFPRALRTRDQLVSALRSLVKPFVVVPAHSGPVLPGTSLQVEAISTFSSLSLERS